MAIMNLVAVAKFFHIIYKALFVSLLATGKVKKGLLEPILNYFATIETNEYRMFYLHCLIWLRRVSHLAMLYFQISDNHEFYQKLLLFLKHIIKCFAYPDPYPEILYYIYPNAINLIITSKSAILLK